MSEQTKIAWCDSTLNFWEGCTKVSAGCTNCYAEARDKRFTGGKLWGKGAPRRKSKSAVKDALRYNKLPWICNDCGKAFPAGTVQFDGDCNCQPRSFRGQTKFHRRRIFSLSLGDWLDDEVPIEWLAEMLDTIRQCDQVIWILCTKRPENWYDRVSLAASHMEAIGNEQCAEWLDAWTDCLDMPERGDIPQNIILLTSVENQEAADKRIPKLLRIPAACRGLSMEPLLGAVDLCKWLLPSIEDVQAVYSGEEPAYRPLNWLIIGGESGANARPCNVDWIRSIVQQGKAAGVATFVKQLGANPKLTEYPLPPLGDGFKLRDKKGGDPSEWPLDIQVQEWPKGF